MITDSILKIQALYKTSALYKYTVLAYQIQSQYWI